MATPQQIAQIRQAALQNGVDPSRIERYIQTRFGQATQPQQPVMQPQGENFLVSLAKTMTKPFVDTGKRIGAAGYETKRAFDINAAKAANDGARLKELGSTQNPFIANERLGRGDVLLDTAKSTAGIASYAVPAGKTLKSAVGLGTGAGGLFGFGASEKGNELEGILSGSIGGGIGGGVAYGGGKLIKGAATKAKGVLSKAAKVAKDRASESAAMNISKVTPAAEDRVVRETGRSVNELVNKYFKSGAGYDDMLGATASKGKGGVLSKQMSAAEKVIKETIGESGDDVIASADDLVRGLSKEKRQLAALPGNEAKITAIDEAIKSVKAKYSGGLNAKQLLEIKRAADSRFGKGVVNESMVNVSDDVQKAIGNKARGILKESFPAIDDALGVQSEIYTLQPILNRARAIGSTRGSELRVGKLSGLTDLVNPMKLTDKALSNPKIGSKLLSGVDDVVVNRGIQTAPPVASPVDDILNSSAEALAESQAARGGALPARIEAMRRAYANSQAQQATQASLINPAVNAVAGPTNQLPTLRQALPMGINYAAPAGAATALSIPSSQQGSVQGVASNPYAYQPEVPQQQQSVFGNMSNQQLLALQLAAPDVFKALMGVEEIRQAQNPAGGDLTAGQQKDRINAMSGLRAIDTVESELLGDGDVNRGLLVAAKLPGSPGARVYETAAREMIDILARMRTGAQITETEEAFYRKQLPSVLDGPDTIKYKINLFKQLFTNLANPGEVSVEAETANLVGF